MEIVESSTGELVRRYREELGLTQAGLADLVGVSASAVNQWENNHTKPLRSNIAPLCAALRKSAAELGLIPDWPRKISAGELVSVTIKDARPIVTKDGVPALGLTDLQDNTIAFALTIQVIELIRQSLSALEAHLERFQPDPAQKP